VAVIQEKLPCQKSGARLKSTTLICFSFFCVSLKRKRWMLLNFHRLNFPSPAFRARPKVSSVFKISVTSAGLARANCLARSAGAIGAAAACKAVSTACIRSGKVLGHADFPDGRVPRVPDFFDGLALDSGR